MLSIDQLQAFTATVESGSFSGAARQLGKVQSAVSQHIINLEIDCGVELFDRSSRYPRLTAQGERLLPYAQATLQQHQRLAQQAQLLASSPNQQLSLAMDEGIPLQGLTHLFKQLATQFPHIEIECLSASSTDVIEMVEQGRASCGIIFSELALPNNLDFENVGSIRFDVYVAAEHELAQHQAPYIDMLRLHRQLVIRSRSHKTSSFHQAFSPEIWYADNYYLLLEMALSGLGWCLLPSYLAESEQAMGKLVRVPVEFEQLAWYTNIDVIQHQRMSADPIHKMVRQLLRQLSPLTDA
ncbi:LysR family transcriptional regulator [Vibrio anguillarum]|uniref:LysR family transcriptional regulator n=1 Tax=Vibrio anguillarum TaxID=55601 RepID=UPI0003121627|nr:LysR family transcriptional regulator [Vibrio anguillarum]